MPKIPVAHFYHVYADGEWKPRAAEYVTALQKADFHADQIVVGLVGSRPHQEGARAYFHDVMPEFGPVSFVYASCGFEQVTLTEVRTWACQQIGNAAVLYAHTKGALNWTALTPHHLRIMTEQVVGRWQDALTALEDYDAAGCFWSGQGFTGNFWWATARYLATLPEVTTISRHDAEVWIGQGSPRAYEMNPEFSYLQMVQAVFG